MASDLRPAFRAARLAILLSPLLPLGLLLLAAVFGARSWKGLLNWWGVPLLISGLAGLAVAAAILPAFQWALAVYSDRLSDVPTSMATIGVEVIRALASGIALRIGVESLLLALIGLAMLVLAGRIAKRPAPAEQPLGE